MYVPEIVVGIVIGAAAMFAVFVAIALILDRNDKKKAQSRKERKNAE